MSKIVILGTQLGAPQIMNELYSQINSNLAEWISQIDTTSLIKECAQNALSRLGKIKGIRKDTTISDYNGNSYNGELIGSLKTNEWPNGLGVKINREGAIEFVADEYRVEWKKEIGRLREFFVRAFRAEAYKSILTIYEYNVEILATVADDGELFFDVEGVQL